MNEIKRTAVLFVSSSSSSGKKDDDDEEEEDGDKKKLKDQLSGKVYTAVPV